MFKKNDTDPRLVSLLDTLRTASPRDLRASARGRLRFLTEAVSVREKRRQSLWTLIPHKEQFAMNILVSVLVTVGLLFGSGAAVSAAQNDLPNEPLYQIKLISEDAKLWVVSDPAQEIEMLMQQAQIRMEEIRALAEAGITPPAEVAIRAQERIHRAIQIASQLDEASQLAALQQIQLQLQTQEQQMSQLHQGTCTECEPVLQQTRDMLRIQLGEVETELETPAIQNQEQKQNQEQHQNQVHTTQTPHPASIPDPQGTCTPALDGTGQQNGGSNLPAGTPMPQNNQNGGVEGGSGSGNGNNPSSGSGGQGGKP